MGVLENELHFLLVCPVYADLRLVYIARKYYLSASNNKLNILLSSKNDDTIKNLATYIYYATLQKQIIMQL